MSLFENLKAEVTELPAATRVRHEGPNPFKEMLSASFADKKGRKVTIPAEAVGEAQRLIRKAAEQLNIGARIVIDAGKDVKATPEVVKEWAEKKSKKHVGVLFEAKERRVRKPKTEETPAAPAADAAPAAPAADAAPAAQ